MTGKEMCEAIVKADIIRKEDGSPYVPEEIWNLSPSGELWPIFALYEATMTYGKY
ncbi:MAG: hypothetical protein QQN63_05645 [Nitrosopumilus sp.]